MHPPVSPLLSAEKQLARVYDQQYRLRLTRQITRILLVLLGALFLAVVLPYVARRQVGAHLAQVGSLAALEVVLSAGLLLGNRLAVRERADAASTVVMVTTVLGSCALALFANFLVVTTHVNTVAGLLSLIVGIIVVGFLGTMAWTITTTLFLNAFTIVAALWVLPSLTGNVTENPLPLLIIEISVQWICATLLSYNQFYFRQTLRALSAAHVSIEQAQQLDEMKDQFISSVNHELRNPIMAMMNYVTVLRQRNREMPPERRATYLDSLDDTGRRVTQLIGSILDIRQMAQHPEDFVPARVPLKETLLASSRLLDPTEARMTERDLFVSIPEDLTIWGNEIYLQQIFTNLLSNAVKYSAPGTAIEVRLYPLAADRRLPGAPVEVIVRDHGLGVPAAQIPLLFHRFARLPRDLTSNTIGNGLGLYLCKVLTEAMGGQIWVESSGIEGEGSTFHLVLPTEALPAPVAEAAAAPAMVMGRWPVRQARLVLAAAVALVVLVGATLAFTQPPVATASVVGDLRFIDVNGGASNGLLLRLTGLAAPPNDSHYQAWLIDTTNEQIISLGNLAPQDDAYALEPGGTPPTINLLTGGNEVEVTLERQPTTVPTGSVAFLGTLPTKAMVHVRHLLASFPTTPAQVGLLVGLLQQMQVLQKQTQMLTAKPPKSSVLNQCVLLSQLAVLEGKSAPPLPASCRALAIPQGDGFGLLAASTTTPGGYIALVGGHASLALQQPDATASIRDHGGHVIEITTALKSQATTLDALLHRLVTHFDASQIATVTAEVQALVGAPQGPGQGGPPSSPDAGQANAFAAYGEGQRMTSFTLTYHAVKR